MFKKLHNEVKNTQLKFSKNLSCKDLYQIRNSMEMTEYKNLLNAKIELVALLIFWIENEECFWEWIVSFLEISNLFRLYIFNVNLFLGKRYGREART